MYTAQQIFDLSMDLIDKRLANGTINPTSTAKYKAKAPGILDMWQKEISRTGDFYKTYEISNKPATNMLGHYAGMDYIEFTGTEITKEGNGSVKAYYFETDAPGTVYIEDYTSGWNTLATIVIADTVVDFEPNKGIVTPTAGATKSRIRFTGTYRYLITNYSLFSTPYQANRVPDYRPWIKKEMPSDFKSLDQVIEEYPQRQYGKSITYKWEGRRDLYISYSYEGSVRVVYKPVPAKITALTQTLEVDEVTSMSGAYFLAAHLLLVEDPDSGNFFQQRYEQLKMETNFKQPLSIQQIVDVYATTSSAGW